jgi:amino acid adenylation domain-containing protein
MSHTLNGITHLNTEQKRALLERLIREKNGDSRVTTDALLPGLFELQADRVPEGIALTVDGETLGYRELDRRSNQLAHRLRRLGVGPEVKVGLFLPRSTAMVVGLLGVLKAGGAYVPLDPDFPEDRLALMIEDAGLAAIVTQDAIAAELPTTAAAAPAVVRLDLGGSLAERESDRRLASRLAPENLAYVIYTSGSTGRPKGVQVTHRALANLLQSLRSLLGITHRDELLAVTTLSFDIAALELFLPLIAGARLALVGRDVSTDGARLARRLGESNVTFLQATPATWRLLLEAGWEGSPALSILCGGEALTRELADRLRDRGARLWNLYGPTETTIWSSAERVEPGTGPVLIGRPIARTQMYVLDTMLRQVPLGVVGELYIGGAGLARGYVNRPGLTAQRFLPDPYGAEPGGRLYRTGDLARWRPDGRLECLGRIDHQVKIRGYRIELGEIEATLARHPALREAAVAAQEDVPGDRRLVAYVVPRISQGPPLVPAAPTAPAPTPASVPTAAEMREWLRRALPEYMVPAHYVVLEALPLTPNGKVDRNALPAPGAGAGRSWPGAEGQDVPPRGPIEEAVALLWAQVLGRPAAQIGVHASFFDLGGHSLLAAQLLSRLRDMFAVDLPLRALFEDPTVAGVARRIVEARRSDSALEVPPLRPAGSDRPDEIPPSFSQQSLWFLEQLSPGQATFNMTVAARVTGPLDVEALRRSLAEIVRRHEALRTRFATVDGRPVQVVAEEIDARPAHVDLRELDPQAREAEARRLAIEEARRPFDLATGPLVRAGVVLLGALDHVVLLSMHHIIGDGWSFGVAASELATLYDAYRRGEDSPLEPLPVQYADYSLWQRGWLQGALRERLVAYWTRQLAGVTPLELPTDRPRPRIRTSRGAVQSFTVPMEVSDRLAALGRREAVTPFMLLLAAFQTLLHRYTGQEDIVVGSPVANRNRSEVEGLIGYFVNMLALRSDLSGDPSFRTLLRRVRAVALGAYEHQDLPFEMVVEALQPPRDPSRTPLFQVMFVLQNNRLPDLGRSELELSPLALDAGTGTAKFELTLVLQESEHGLLGGLEYNIDLFDSATIDRMIRHFQTLLESIAADPDRRLTALPWLDPADRRQVLETWSAAPRVDIESGTEGAPPRPPGLEAAGIHHRVEAHAGRTPDALALVFGTETMTYRTLNARANRLARRLSAIGVGPESVVGVCATRSPSMIVGLLGVLKAGGAYMPIDPDSPGERLALLLEDARVRVLLTQEHLQAQLPGCDAFLVMIEEAEDLEEPEAPAPPLSATNLAYLIYTSGSTGRPKGVMVEHASLIAAATAWEQSYALRPGQRHLQAAGFGFDVFTGDWVRALTTGGTLVSCPRDALLDPSALAALLREERIDCVELVPAVAEALASEVERTGGTLAPLSLLAVGSDTLQSDLFGRLRRLVGPSGRVVNSYGLTEATIDSTFYEGAPSDRDPTGLAPIGRPFGRTRVYVLDGRLGPLPAGVAGELYIGGGGVARGYRDRPAWTASRFVPDPYSTATGARLYRTGDRGRWRPDGVLELLGRTDHQVKVRGYRIELGEVESALRRHPSVREAVVEPREDSRGNKRLVGYVVPRAGSELVAVELRRWLQAMLPEPMVPSAFVRLESPPLSAHGKIDRRQLPDPGPGTLDPVAEYVAPRTPLEERLAAVWAEVLDLERVGVHDDFFDLGGHSLQSVQLVARLTAALNRPVSVKMVFQAPTVAALAEVLQREEAQGSDHRAEGSHGHPALVREFFHGPPEALPAHVTAEERPLLELLDAGELAPVDSVALSYLPSGLLHVTGLDAATVIHDWCGDRPFFAGVRQTHLGRIGLVVIPRFDDQLYQDRGDLLAALGDGVRLARRMGASMVSLTGLLPSASDYGRALAGALEGQGLPRVTTGHATTTSAVVLAIRRALEDAGREAAGEHVGFVGLGSVGVATLRLLLSCLPHPTMLSLCDVYAKQDSLEALRREVVDDLGYRGEVRLLASRHEVPDELYEARLIVGATNVPDILDIGRVAPGTIVVDDSAPHAFRTDEALRRFQQRGDILVTEGGVLAAPMDLPLLAHVPAVLEPWLKVAFVSLLARSQPRYITGCVLSGLLSARYDELPPTVGWIDRRTALAHYETLTSLGITAARLHLDDSPLDERLIAEFRRRYGGRASSVSQP